MELPTLVGADQLQRSSTIFLTSCQYVWKLHPKELNMCLLNHKCPIFNADMCILERCLHWNKKKKCTHPQKHFKKFKKETKILKQSNSQEELF